MTAVAVGTGCTRDTPRCVLATRDNAALPSCCRGHLAEMVRALQAACAVRHIDWWADYGTLLGAVRNPLTTKANYPWLDPEGLPDGPLPAGIIPHDTDVDLGGYASDWDGWLAVADDLREQGYLVIASRNFFSLKIRLSPVNPAHVDVFTWSESPDGTTLGRHGYVQCDQFKGRHFPSAWLEPATQLEWEGMRIPAPADPAAFCAFRYGEGWATPVRGNHDGVRRSG